MRVSFHFWQVACYSLCTSCRAFGFFCNWNLSPMVLLLSCHLLLLELLSFSLVCFLDELLETCATLQHACIVIYYDFFFALRKAVNYQCIRYFIFRLPHVVVWACVRLCWPSRHHTAAQWLCVCLEAAYIPFWRPVSGPADATIELCPVLKVGMYYIHIATQVILLQYKF